MIKTETQEELVLIMTEHKQLGYTLSPYIVVHRGETYPQMQQATEAMLSSGDYPFSEQEAQMIRTLHTISDAKLCANYSRGVTQLAFWTKVSETVVKDRIVPFVDQQINAALDIALSIDTPIFYRQAGYKQLYDADRLRTARGKVRPTFFFFLTQRGELSYTLKINDGQQDLSIYGRKMMELAGDPAAIVIGGTLYRFKNIQSSKFRPFMQKSRILVQPSVVPKYMQTYVRQCVMNHYVRASGFRVLKREGECRPLLKMEDDVFGSSLNLYFVYGQNTYAYGDSRRSVDIEQSPDGKYTFYTSVRQTEREKQMFDILVDEGLVCTDGHKFVPDGLTTPSPVDIVGWLCVHGDALKRSGIEWQAEASDNYYIGSVDLRVDVDDKIDWFDINGTVVFDGFEIPFAKFLRHLREGKREYKLPDGRFFLIPEEWFATWSEVAQFATDHKGVLSLQKIHAPLLPSGLVDSGAALPAWTDMNATPIERRGDVCATLRPYQLNGFQWLAMLAENGRGGILADDMGLGKTLQVITLLSHVYSVKAEGSADSGKPFAAPTNDTGLPPSLIVMPVSLLHNWRNELRKFAPHLRVYVYAMGDRPRSAELGRILKHYHVVITSYGIVRNDAQYLSPYTFQYLILDESQYVKNPTSKTYQALSTLNAMHRLTMSGTPIENRLIDLWAQMNIVNPGLLGSANFFRNYFERIITRDPEGERAQRLRQMTAPYILRRTKEMVATDLPPVSQQVVYCPMTDEQRERYEAEKSVFRNQILEVGEKAETLGADKLQVLQALMRLRLMANHPQLIDASYQGSSGKTELVVEHIENVVAEGHKLLVFSSFVRDLDLLARILTEKGIGHVMLTGQTRNREQVIDHFQQSESDNVFLISLKAGGVGLNLTCADYVFVLNPWWNPAAESQAINRAHRIGQTKNVFVYRFLTKDSIEEKIALLQEKKRTLANDFIATDNVVNDLSIDELRELA